MKAIRAECLECCNGKSSEVRLCVSKSCSLWLYRFGRRPTAEEIDAVADVVSYPLERGVTQAEIARGGPLKAICARYLDCSAIASPRSGIAGMTPAPCIHSAWGTTRTSGFHPSARPSCGRGFDDETPFAARKRPCNWASAAVRRVGA